MLSLGLWAAVNRPVRIPDFQGQVGGLDFSPFQRGQSPETGTWPAPAQIRADLVRAAALTGRIRTYSVQGDFAAIPALAAGLPLRITLGAWIDGHPLADAAELDRLVSTARANRNVERVLVGNETLLRRDLTAPQLIAAIRRVRASLRVPVSTAEPWHVWLKHPELAREVDYITIHLLPYWEGLSVDDALRFSLDKLNQVRAAYPDKPIVIGEIGWPSNGVDVGAATASRVNQAAFLRRFFIAARQLGLDYFVMEAFDQPWKTSFEGRAAGYWGVLDLDRHAKWPLTGPVREVPCWPFWAGGSVAAGILLAGALLARRVDIRLTGKLVFAALTQVFVAGLTGMLLAMSGRYLDVPTALVWSVLAASQVLLLLLLLANGFELAETVWGGVGRRGPQLLPAAPATHLPKVSIHLPICNEPAHLVFRTLDALAMLDYPSFEVLVVDNNTTDPALWEPVAEHCARLGARFRFFHLGAWPGFKAGALNFALRQTAEDAEIVGVLDSDYVVSSDWLRCTVPQFARPGLGVMQSPQDYRDNDGSFFKRLMFWEYAGFFQLGMVTRNERNAIIQHGTMSLIRKQALLAVGGWAEWCICEDAELGLRLLRAGWQALYAPRSFGRGVMPDDFAAFRRQRFRWAYGAMRICRRHWVALLDPFNRELTLGQRWHFVTGWLPWLGDALGLVFLLVGLAWSVGLILAPARTEFPTALFMLPSIGLFAFKLVHSLGLYRDRVPCGLADRIGAVIAGLALSHTIAKAVWRGMAGGGRPFLRTPKIGRVPATARTPAFVHGLMMAREELALLLATWAAMIGVGEVHTLATWETRLWCAVLLTQSVPYAASVLVAVAAALPAPIAGLARPATGVRHPAPAMARPAADWSAAGD
jgi:exo-beta-1,3-glucanase (GH17 family)/cellulose synthase/poly-beta-1,6-N-acetylglucosamine synthase-like glycosyltransferase